MVPLRWFPGGIAGETFAVLALPINVKLSTVMVAIDYISSCMALIPIGGCHSVVNDCVVNNYVVNDSTNSSCSPCLLSLAIVSSVIAFNDTLFSTFGPS